MTILKDPTSLEHLDALHTAIDYIPKRALRFFLDGSSEKIETLIEEMEGICEDPEEFSEEGSSLLYFGFLILASLRREEGIGLVRKFGLLSSESIELFLGDQFFNSFPLVIAELYKYAIEDLKALIEDEKIEPAVRAAAIQSMMFLFGNKVIARADVVSYFKGLLENRKEKIPYFYDVIAGASFALHPEELIDSLRACYEEGFIDAEEMQLSEIEEILPLPKEQVVEESRPLFTSDLKDVIAHLEQAYRGVEGPERNDPCPCGSGQKFKKCCK